MRYCSHLEILQPRGKQQHASVRARNSLGNSRYISLVEHSSIVVVAKYRIGLPNVQLKNLDQKISELDKSTETGRCIRAGQKMGEHRQDRKRLE
jgi:hypothetical protein